MKTKTKKIILYVGLLLGGILIFLFGCTLIDPGPAIPWYDPFTGENRWGTGGIITGFFILMFGVILIIWSFQGLEEWV